MSARFGFIVAVFAFLALGCASSVDVHFDESEDFSRYRSWDWIPGEAIVVIAPFENEQQIASQLASRIESEFAPLGLSLAPGGGEVRVGVVYAAVRDLEYYETTSAVETLNSFSNTPSYETQTIHTEVRVVDRCRISLYVSDRANGRLVWQAEVNERFNGGCQPQLRSTIRQLVSHFPGR